MSDANHLLQDALTLTPQERLELAVELIDSVEGRADPDWTASWRQELTDRVRAADQREVRGREWSEVRSRILNLLAGQ